MTTNLCPVRCFCGQQAQSHYTTYCQLVRSGKTIKQALDTCGLPMSSPFAPPLGDKNWYLTPPSICCRALMMCNSDLSTQHNIYQSVVRWAEGDAALGVANKPQPSTIHKNADLTLFTPAQQAHKPVEPKKHTVTFTINNSNIIITIF